jgi:ATP-dependent helicase IRC3
MEFELRDYQKTCVESNVEGYERGLRRMLNSSPTGSGKTVIICHLVARLRDLVAEKNPARQQIFLLAHREELCDQLKSTASLVNPSLSVDIERAEDKADPEADIIVASVPTLGRAGSARIEKFDPDKCAVIVVDECHHATASTYKNIFNYFGVSKKGPIASIGFTATAKRHDKVGLKDAYDEIVFHKSVMAMMEERHLCKMRCWKVETKTSLDDIRVQAGEFSTKPLAETVDTEERNKIIVAAWGSYAYERKSTVVFAVNVAHAMSLRDAFRLAGVDCECVVGATDKGERRETLRRFKDGEIPMITNVSVLTEGTDIPNIDCIVLAKPTRSPLVLTQSIGRGLRNHVNKEDVMIIDVVDSLRNGSLMTVPSLLGLSPDFDMNGSEATETITAIEKLASQNPSALDTGSLADAQDVAASSIDLFDMKPDPEIEKYSKYDWRSAGEDHWAINLKDFGHIEICRNVLDQYEVIWHRDSGKMMSSQPVENMSEAFEKADGLIGDFTNLATLAIVDKEAKWRGAMASEKQLIKLKKWRVPHNPKTITKGEAKELMDAKISQWNRGKKPPKKDVKVESGHLNVSVGVIE